MTEEVRYDNAGRLDVIKATKGTATLTLFDYDYNVGSADTALRQRVLDKDANVTTYDYNDPLTG